MRLGAANRAQNANKKAEEVDEEEATRLLEEKRLRKLERKRQKKLCLEMYEKKSLVKNFIGGSWLRICVNVGKCVKRRKKQEVLGGSCPIERNGSLCIM